MLGADGRPNFRTRSPHVKSRPDIRQEARGREGFGSGQDGDVGGHPPHRPERDSETKCKEGHNHCSARAFWSAPLAAPALENQYLRRPSFSGIP